MTDPDGTANPADDNGGHRSDQAHAGDAVGEVDEVAALRATVEVQQLSLNRLSAQVRDLADQLAHVTNRLGTATPTDTAASAGTPTPRETEEKPAPWCWRGMPERQAAALWRELADWLAWLHTRYPLAETIPSCWWRHPELVEELTAAHAAWKTAYQSPGAGPYAPAEWHDRWLPGLEHRLTTRWKTGRCTDHHHQPRSPSAYGIAVDDPGDFHAHTQTHRSDDGGVSVPEVVPMTEITDAVTSGDAEIIGADLGDPLYWRRRFWQITAEADGYLQVTDPAQLHTLHDARGRLRRARATHTTEDKAGEAGEAT